MKLTQNYLSDNKQEFLDKGINLPKFDREKVAANTKANPKWIHFGAGNIFKAFPAAVQQELLNKGLADTGVIVAEGYDYEIIDKVSTPHDNLALLVTLKSDGHIEQTVIGSIVESLKVDSEDANEFARLKEIFAAPSLQMVSFTITEKGYSLTNVSGDYLPDVKADLENGPSAPKSYLGKLVALCYHRYEHGQLPVALVSMDNVSHNGTKLYDAVNTIAKIWAENGLADKGFVDYINNKDKVGFPWSMIDKITPRPDEGVQESLKALGFTDMEPVVTSKNTYVAPFVNAEETQYLVTEDWFPNGRPNLDKGGIIYTDRETVDKVERMKVTTCLNPLHTALAVFGCLLGYTKISDEMKDQDLLELVKNIGYVEGLPVVVDPKILSPKDFLDTVINVRFPNPFMPDTPQRIATDTSQKLSIRFGETIKAYHNSDTLDVKDLKSIPLVLAAWCRYLMGVDDNGNKFELSPDPMLAELVPLFKDINIGDKGPFHETLRPVLSNKTIFGVDLYEVGLGEIVENNFTKLVASKGAIRESLKSHYKD